MNAAARVVGGVGGGDTKESSARLKQKAASWPTSNKTRTECR